MNYKCKQISAATIISFPLLGRLMLNSVNALISSLFKMN